MNSNQICQSLVKVALFSYLMFFCLKGQSQTLAVADSFYTDTIIIDPLFPTVFDSVKVTVVKYIPWPGKVYQHQLSLSKDTFDIYTCVGPAAPAAFYFYDVKHNLGLLPAGSYTISALIRNSDSISCLQPTGKRQYRTFTVSANVSAQEYPFSEVQVGLYPSPATNTQKLVLNTPISQNLEIALYDVSGRKIQEVFKGLSVQGEQSFQVDLNQVPAGLYVYHIVLGNEIRFLKFAKE